MFVFIMLALIIFSPIYAAEFEAELVVLKPYKGVLSSVDAKTLVDDLWANSFNKLVADSPIQQLTNGFEALMKSLVAYRSPLEQAYLLWSSGRTHGWAKSGTPADYIAIKKTLDVVMKSILADFSALGKGEESFTTQLVRRMREEEKKGATKTFDDMLFNGGLARLFSGQFVAGPEDRIDAWDGPIILPLPDGLSVGQQRTATPVVLLQEDGDPFKSENRSDKESAPDVSSLTSAEGGSSVPVACVFQLPSGTALGSGGGVPEKTESDGEDGGEEEDIPGLRVTNDNQAQVGAQPDVGAQTNTSSEDDCDEAPANAKNPLQASKVAHATFQVVKYVVFPFCFFFVAKVYGPTFVNIWAFVKAAIAIG